MTFTKLPKAISAEELLSTPLSPVKWIIPGLLPAGLALFAGPSKAGKSWLTLWLCLQIAQGNPVWNREIEPRTVIYFSLEDTFNRLQNRIFQLIDGGDAPERLILQTECLSIGQGLEEQVESLIHTYCDVGLIVIDTLQKVRVSDGNDGMYANDYKEAGALKKIADKYGICILLIHHLRKQSAADPFDQISGSTGLMGVADTSWVMQRKRMSQTADILLTGRDMDDRTLHLREENCIWTLEDEETAEEREIKAVPDYLWTAAEYIESVGNWQGTASELLAAAGIENAKPNQFTYNMAKYFDKVFEPKNIRYKTHRKNKVRLLSFYGDDGDGGDDDIDITQLLGWGIPERPSPSSPSSLGALEGSKHSVWISTTHFWGEPQTPAVEKCYDFLNYSHFPLTGWEAVWYPEPAEILCAAPLQLNTQHNRYFTLPVGRTAWSRQTITRDWGEGMMILLLPHASDGVTELGL